MDCIVLIEYFVKKIYLGILRKIILNFLFTLSAFFVVNIGFAQVQFIQNKGQWDSKVNYRGDFSTGAFFLENQGFTVLVNDPTDLNAVFELIHGGHKPLPATPQPVILHSQAYKVDFLGNTGNIQKVPDKMLPNYNNYFIGNDPAKWAGDCKIFQAVTYENVYPHIDVRYYSDAGNLKYDLIVHPGGNIDAIAMRYTGVENLSVKNKELNIGTTVGNIKELYPYSYQVMSGKRETVECKYVVKDNIVRFKVKDYSPNSTIVIDPTIIFCSFTGSSGDNWGYTATPGPDGSFFAGGIVYATGYPVSPGAFQTVFAGGVGDDAIGLGYDIAIIKLSPDGTNRVYATYLGGSGGNEQPHSMICDGQGNLIVAGRSNSPSTGAGAYPLKPAGNTVGPGGGYDIVITKFNAAGTAILGSVKIGGAANDGVNIRGKYVAPDGVDATRRNYGDDARSEVILDNNNNVYLASCTQSSGLEQDGGFPIRNSLIQPVFGGGRQDGVIIKLTPDLSSVLFSTYFGANGDDACFVLSLSPVTGNLYVAGGTTNAAGGNITTPLPGDKTTVIHDTNQGGETDGFVTELKNDGSAVIKTTYLGTTGNDLVYGLKFDKFGFPYVMGTTTGSWPVISAGFSNVGGKQFISKLQPDLSAFVYSTVFGTNTGTNGPPNLSPNAFLVDRCQNVYVSGWGGGINIDKEFPSAGTFGLSEVNPLVNGNGQPITQPDGADFYFFVLEKNAQSQLFGSHFGQNGGFGDHVDGGTSRFDANGIIYQAICANCGHGAVFPTTPGVWAPLNGASICNEAGVKIEMNFAGVGASVKATIDGVVDTIGCVPLTINFTDTLAKGKMYIWDYGDTSSPKKDTTFAPNNSTSHIYTHVGTYRVMLVSVDSTTCNVADTAYVNVKVGNNTVTADFDYVKLDSCNSLRYKFNNKTTAVLPNYTNQSFLWDFGDGSPKIRTGFTSVIHTFPSVGTYKIVLIVDDTTFCNEPDSAQKTLRISPNVRAMFTTPAIGCVPYAAQFENTSLGGTDFYWEFGDGTPLTLNNNPTFTYTYNNTGTYNVRLIAIDTGTCNKVDTSAYFAITVFPIPTASFSWSPDPPKENTPTQFFNNSSGANRYVWDFGDGDGSTDINPVHQYNATGTYKAILYAFNVANCVDSLQRNVPVIIVPLLDVPNAFTPGRFGTNAIVMVVGFGIGKMDWRIYNRWGQVVFRTEDRKQGWDGTFKGTLQPMDVYTYTLDVEFTDGVKLRKTGDISLLR